MKAAPETLSPEQAAFLVRRVARLATADAAGAPHAVPVCFAFSGVRSSSPSTINPKTFPRAPEEGPEHPREPERRARRGPLRRRLEPPGFRHGARAGRAPRSWQREHTAAIRLLRGKYHQYEEMRIEDNPVICIRPERVVSWGALDVAGSGEPTVLDAVRGRRSVRRYLPREVPEDLVEAVLEAGRWAPSPHGTAVALRRRYEGGDQRAARRGDGRGVAGQPRDGRPGSRGRREPPGLAAAAARRARARALVPVPR